MTAFSRRDFLKLAGATLAAACLPAFDPALAAQAPALGRAIRSARSYDRPSFTGSETGYYSADNVFGVLEETTGDVLRASPIVAHNPVWLRTDKGWVHSSYVQPVKNQVNEPLLKVPPGGFLAQVTVPYVQVYRFDDDVKKKAYRLYYDCTAWVAHVGTDASGNVWYRLLDDLDKKDVYVIAKNLRQVAAEEVKPIAPDVTDKRVEVDLTAQKITAVENGRAVFSTRVATGTPGIETPLGEFRVERKQPSRHMVGVPGETGFYDLPGVPWVCFISWTGVSLHGTYWHNNYGRPQSHGCINMTPQDALWFYRWTAPVVPIDKDYVGTKTGGTRVLIYK